ncbi:MAG: LamG domain-containing protein, partial [Candidatus Aenigmarchaeota archaeon]|nr:LamG domain-containing protein [Candidatus Aenigmarchaeota archaeon]
MTVSTWIYPHTLGGTSLGRIIFRRSTTSSTTGATFHLTATNAIRFDFTGSTVLIRQTSNNVYSFNTWNHVVLTWDGSVTAANIHIYVNGTEVTYVTTTNGAGLYSTASQATFIGARGDESRVFDGSIDEVRVYNRTLSADEILAIYNSTRPYFSSEELPSAWSNDSWVSMTGTQNWSNVTKWVNSTVGANIAWKIYANDTDNQWNSTDVFNYTTTEADTIPPTITITSPQNTTYTSSQIDLNVTVSEPANSCWWNIDSGTNDTMSGSGMEWDDVISASDGQHQLFVYCNDTVGNLGLNSSVWFTVSLLQVQNTRMISPSLLVARTNETVNSTAYVKYMQGNNPVYMINITVDVPYDFTPPSESGVRVYFIDYAPYERREITGNTSVNVSVLAPGGGANIRVMVNISNVSETSAGGYMEVNDSIEIFYYMNSSQMLPNASRTVYTNSTLKDNQSQTGSASILTQINSSEVVLRGYKSIWIPDLSNPQNLSVEIVVKAIGGPISGILLSDYLPQGASIAGTLANVTYYNSSTGNTKNLVNGSDYYVANPSQTTLPDGAYVDLYYYNFSYKSLNWDGNLYDN